MNEQLETIKVLIEARPDLCREVDKEGEIVLHTYILKVLSQLWNEDELAKLTDRHHNTFLHLAMVQKHIQVVERMHVKSMELYLSHNRDWLEKQRGILILALILVAATSFYSGLHPPGGTFSGSGDGPLGNAVRTEVVMDDFTEFVIQNTIIMVVSLMILLMLLSGIPLGSKFCSWVLNLATHSNSIALCQNLKES